VGLNYAFQTRDKLFLILEYCPGGDLGKVLEQEKRFDEGRARIYLAEILLALEDLHKRDIIFRDLKPDNVVLDTQGHALLTDFGLSKEGVLDNQAANSFCGSVAYLAPEMLKRSGHGKSVDWYLLGVLLYEMLVGMPPYFNRDREKLVSNIQKGPLLMPS
jgi:serine/threonine protein kinase